MNSSGRRITSDALVQRLNRDKQNTYDSIAQQEALQNYLINNQQSLDGETTNVTSNNLPQVNTNQTVTPKQQETNDASFWEKLGDTIVDLPLTLIKSLAQSGESIIDFVAMHTGEEGAEWAKKDFLGVNDLGNWIDDVTDNSWFDKNGFARKLTESVGQQVPARLLALIPYVGPVLSAIYFFGSASGSAMTDALNEGATYKQAMLYGYGSGALEEATELLGGWAFEGGSIGEKLLKKTGIGKKILSNTVGKFLFDMAGEGIEEMISEVVDPYLKFYTYQQSLGAKDVDYASMQQVLEAGMYGALSAGILQGGQVMLNNRVYGSNKVLQQLGELNDISENTLKEEKRWQDRATKQGGTLTEQQKNRKFERMESLKQQQDSVLNQMTNTINDLKQARYDRLMNKLGNRSLGRANVYTKTIESNGKKIEGLSYKQLTLKDLDTTNGKFKINDEGAYFENNGYFYALDNDANIEKFDIKNKEKLQVIKQGVKTFEALKSKANLETDIIFTDNLGENENGYYDPQINSLFINVNSDLMNNANNQQKVITFVTGHEFTHSLQGTKSYEKLRSWLVGLLGKDAYDEEFNAKKLAYSTKVDFTDWSEERVRDYINDEIMADQVGRLMQDEKFVNRFVEKSPTLAKRFTNWLKQKLGGMKNYADKESKTLRRVYDATYTLLNNAIIEKQANNIFKEASTRYNLTTAKDVENQTKLKEELTENYNKKFADNFMNVYNQYLDFWEETSKLLESRTLDEWNSRDKSSIVFSFDKPQAGYKYNKEIKTLCAKGLSLFEAIDKIVTDQVVKETAIEGFSSDNKELLYSILKRHGYPVPCEVCYVEQARRKEGTLIDYFLNGDGKDKIGWNKILNRIEEKTGIKSKTFDRSITTSIYTKQDNVYTQEEIDRQNIVLQEIINEEIRKYNQEHEDKKKPLLLELTKSNITASLKGSLPSNLKQLKEMLINPDIRLRIDSDMLFSSYATRNIASQHSGLYAIFNSLGGSGGYKTKQRGEIYNHDILNLNNITSKKTRNAGGIRTFSNSDFEIMHFIDIYQYFSDLTSKKLYLQNYTKVLSYAKLFGKSGAKINISMIPAFKYYDKNGKITTYQNMDVDKTMEMCGLDEDGSLLADTVEGVNIEEAIALISDPEYSKNCCIISIGFSDKHIAKMLDDSRIGMIIGYHDKINNIERRMPLTRYAKNYNGSNETRNAKNDVISTNFSSYLSRAETLIKNGKGQHHFNDIVYGNRNVDRVFEYNDIPKLATTLYLQDCYQKGWTPMYESFCEHENFYKLMADFGLYDSQGNYCPHQPVNLNIPEKVFYLDNGNKVEIDTQEYIVKQMQRELELRDNIARDLASTEEDSIINEYVKANEYAKENDMKPQDAYQQMLGVDRIGSALENAIRLNKLPKFYGVEANPNRMVRFSLGDDIRYSITYSQEESENRVKTIDKQASSIIIDNRNLYNGIQDLGIAFNNPQKIHVNDFWLPKERKVNQPSAVIKTVKEKGNLLAKSKLNLKDLREKVWETRLKELQDQKINGGIKYVKINIGGQTKLIDTSSLFFDNKAITSTGDIDVSLYELENEKGKKSTLIFTGDLGESFLNKEYNVEENDNFIEATLQDDKPIEVQVEIKEETKPTEEVKVEEAPKEETKVAKEPIKEETKKEETPKVEKTKDEFYSSQNEDFEDLIGKPFFTETDSKNLLNKLIQDINNGGLDYVNAKGDKVILKDLLSKVNKKNVNEITDKLTEYIIKRISKVDLGSQKYSAYMERIVPSVRERVKDFIQNNAHELLTNKQYNRLTRSIRQLAGIVNYLNGELKYQVKINKQSRIINHHYRDVMDISKNKYSESPESMPMHEISTKGITVLKKLDVKDVSNPKNRQVMIDFFDDFYLTNKVLQEDDLFDNQIAEMKEIFTYNKELDPNAKLSIDEVLTMKKILAYVKHFAKNYNKVIIDGKRQSAKEAATSIDSKLNVKKGKMSNSILMEAERSIEKPAVILDSISEDIRALVYDGLRKSQNKYYGNVMKLNAKFDEFNKRNKKYYKKLNKQSVIINNVYINGKKTSINCTLGEALTLLQWSKRDQARGHFVIEDLELLKDLNNKSLPKGVNFYDKKQNVTYENVLFTDESFKDIESVLTKTDREYLDIVSTTLNGLAREMKVEVDNEQFGFSNIEDGDTYFPIKTDKKWNNYKNYGDARNTKSIDSILGAYFNFNTVSHANNSLISTNIAVIVNQHLDMIAKYNAYYSTVKAIQRVLNTKIGNTALRNDLYKRWTNASNYIDNLILDTINVETHTQIEKIFSGIRSRMAVASLGLNPKVWFNQWSSIPTAMTILKVKNVTKGLFGVGISRSKNIQNMDDYCVYAKYRDYDMQGVIGDANVVSELYSKTSKAFMSMIKKFDREAIIRLWNACQYQIQDETGYKIGTTENLTRAGELLDEVIRKTQPNYNALETPTIKRSKNEIVKTMTMFTTQPLQNLSQLTSSVRKYYDLKKNGASKEQLKQAKRQINRSMASVFVANLMYSLVALGFKYWLDKDDEEKSFLSQLFENVSDAYIGMIPIFKDIYNAIVKNYDIELSVTSSFNDVISGTKSLITSLERGEDPQTVWYKFAKTFSGVTGIPFKNITDDIGMIVATFDKKTAYKFRSLWYNRTVSEYSNDFTKAVNNNDTKKANLIMERIYSEKGITISNKDSISELTRLMSNGLSVTPTNVNSTISFDKVSYSLSNREIKQFKEVYSELGNNYLKNLFDNSYYKSLKTDSEKSRVVNYVTKYAYYQALAKVKKVNITNGSNKLATLAQVIDINTLATIYVKCKYDDSLMNNKAKIFKYINSIKGITKYDKIMLYILMGYKYKNLNTDQLAKYLKVKKHLSKDDINSVLKCLNLIDDNLD